MKDKLGREAIEQIARVTEKKITEQASEIEKLKRKNSALERTVAKLDAQFVILQHTITGTGQQVENLQDESANPNAE